MDVYVTVVGFKSFFYLKPFVIGNVLCCVKDPGNEYDHDAIRVTLPVVGTVGYLSNSPATAAGGTAVASRIYEQMPDKFFVRVLFTTHTKVICRIEPDSEEAEAEMIAMIKKD